MARSIPYPAEGVSRILPAGFGRFAKNAASPTCGGIFDILSYSMRKEERENRLLIDWARLDPEGEELSGEVDAVHAGECLGSHAASYHEEKTYFGKYNNTKRTRCPSLLTEVSSFHCGAAPPTTVPFS